MPNAPSHAAAAGNSSVISGAYIGIWNDMDLGNTLDGFQLMQKESGRVITADILGEGMIDQIYAGGNYSIQMTLENWNAQAIEPLIWWHGNSIPGSYDYGLSNGPGQNMWDNAKPLVLYACHSTGFDAQTYDDDNNVITRATGASATNPYIDPLDMVFFKTLCQPNEQIQIDMSHKERFITLTLDIYPVANNYNETDLDPSAPTLVNRVDGCSAVRYWSATRGTAPNP
jgi:hypothetical protein